DRRPRRGPRRPDRRRLRGPPAGWGGRRGRGRAGRRLADRPPADRGRTEPGPRRRRRRRPAVPDGLLRRGGRRGRRRRHRPAPPVRRPLRPHRSGDGGVGHRRLGPDETDLTPANALRPGRRPCRAGRGGSNLIKRKPNLGTNCPLCPVLSGSSHSPKRPSWGRIGSRGRNDASEPPTAVIPPGAARAADATVAPLSRPAYDAIAPGAGRPLGSRQTESGPAGPPCPGARQPNYAPSSSTCVRKRRISDARKRRCPPRVRTAEILPARAQRVTVLGLTLNITATSLGVRSSLSAIAVVLPDVWIASIRVIGPNRPVLEDQLRTNFSAPSDLRPGTGGWPRRRVRPGCRRA